MVHFLNRLILEHGSSAFFCYGLTLLLEEESLLLTNSARAIFTWEIFQEENWSNQTVSQLKNESALATKTMSNIYRTFRFTSSFTCGEDKNFMQRFNPIYIVRPIRCPSSSSSVGRLVTAHWKLNALESG